MIDVLPISQALLLPTCHTEWHLAKIFIIMVTVPSHLIKFLVPLPNIYINNLIIVVILASVELAVGSSWMGFQ